MRNWAWRCFAWISGIRTAMAPGNALVVVEAFKIYGGQIHAVEAFMRVMKAGTPSGWNYEMKKAR